MKKAIKLPIILLIALTVILAVGVLGFADGKTAKADSYEITNTYISGYKISYDIKSDRSINVIEDITVSFDRRSGFLKYIPINAGEQVRNIRVTELVKTGEKDVYCGIEADNEFIYLDIGDSAVKNGERTYRISYEYCLTRAQEGKNLLALTPIGADVPCKIENIYIEMRVPEGYIKDSAVCFYNYRKSRTDIDVKTVSQDGATVLTAEIDRIEANTEVRFDANFADGALSVYSDPTPYLFLIPALILAAVLAVLKFFVFNKNYLTPVVNYEAPNKMDPLLMGKLIDNKVNGEDVTSLIYYWASKGYLKINLDNQNDPALIRIMQNLPENSSPYEKLMYNNLFKGGDSVKTSQLTNRFYKTVEQVTAMVNKRAGNLYEVKSIAASIAFAVLGGLLAGIAPIVLALVNISSKLIYFQALIIIVPFVVINFGAHMLVYYRLKLNKLKFAGICAGLVFGGFVAGLFYVILVPDGIIGLGAKILLYVVCCLISGFSVVLITRTKDYTQKLNDIIGFKNFITLAEKDQLEMMLEDDPQFYYHILPYAQVLGVTDKWEEKFANLTIEPPQWATGNAFTNYLEFRLINNILRSSMRNISSGMVSRPSSSARSGGSHGGHFGGFSGGGHGGGGIRFR